MKTKEEILKEATKRTLNINEGSPMHDAIMKAMEEYAKNVIESNFCDGSPTEFKECSVKQLEKIHHKVNALVDWVNE